MSGRLLKELKMSRPFRDLEEEALLNLHRTNAVLMQPFTDLLRSFSVTIAQYNVLRILRGAGGDGLSCGEIGARMLTRDPDMTRLLDRMEKQGLIERVRDQRDRRVVTTSISAAGLQVLDGLDERVRKLRLQILGSLGEARLRALIDTLEEVRAQAAVLTPDEERGAPPPAS